MYELGTPSSRLVIFILLLLLLIPSIICSLYIFYHFVRSRDLRERVSNHGVLMLLIITFVQVSTSHRCLANQGKHSSIFQVTGELPLSLIFLRRGSAASASDSFCRFWIILNYILASSGLWTMAFTSIQRYWLVFHRTFFDRHRWFFHYIPMTCCILYPTILYICLLTVYSCQNQFDYSQWTCGGPCYLYEVDGTENLFEMSDLFFASLFLEPWIG